jgi:hypothetical protein
MQMCREGYRSALATRGKTLEGSLRRSAAMCKVWSNGYAKCFKRAAGAFVRLQRRFGKKVLAVPMMGS